MSGKVRSAGGGLEAQVGGEERMMPEPDRERKKAHTLSMHYNVGKEGTRLPDNPWRLSFAFTGLILDT